jgi:hypothetical protein
MDSLDKKSLHLLAGIKQPLNECMNTSDSVVPAKTPATIQIMANSGDEVASMLRTLAAMDEKTYGPEHAPGDHIDRSQMVKVPSMTDLMSKIDQYEEIKDDAHFPYTNTPNEEDVSLGNFPGGLGRDNYSLGRAGDHLTNRNNERMVTPEGLMDQYRNFMGKKTHQAGPLAHLSDEELRAARPDSAGASAAYGDEHRAAKAWDTEMKSRNLDVNEYRTSANEGDHLSDPNNLNNLTTLMKQYASKLGLTPDKLEAQVRDAIMREKGITPPQSPTMPKGPVGSA